MPTKPTCVLYHYTLQLYLFPILFYTSVLPNELTQTLTIILTIILTLTAMPISCHMVHTGRPLHVLVASYTDGLQVEMVVNRCAHATVDASTAGPRRVTHQVKWVRARVAGVGCRVRWMLDRDESRDGHTCKHSHFGCRKPS